ncbi:RNA-directed DNA polymerase from mobile element jockey [Elysia marginata]|uniref:RNA-directed DNA polymerase from mobile element jockey n=1 Tax=Elysia marginata TaxID=1093978 RepID=A0AAV4HM47_9GAST|nr:RNA-directed DNA polymerase from mobile element jockey [Elysia marginata]
MLEVERKSDEEKLLGMKELGGLKVKVTKDSYLNTSRGVINHRDLRGSREEEFVEWIPEVISARRIEIKKGEERIKTNTYVLTFDSPTPPFEVKKGYLPVKVRPYVPTPMHCFRCHRFGHGRDRCRAREELCVKCGEPGHRGEESKRKPRCVNCKGEHPANSRSCPKYMKEQAILRYRAQNGGTFEQARAAVIVEVAKEMRPKLYAQAVRGGPIPKMALRPKVVLVWIPSHVGIPGNEKVDELAKLALNKEVHDDKQVIWSDLKLKVNTHVEQLWQTDWDTEVDNKLHEIRSNLKENSIMMKD